MKSVFAILIDSLAMMISPALEATFDYFELQFALRELREKPIRHLQPLTAGQFKSARLTVVASSDDMRLSRLS